MFNYVLRFEKCMHSIHVGIRSFMAFPHRSIEDKPAQINSLSETELGS